MPHRINIEIKPFPDHWRERYVTLRYVIHRFARPQIEIYSIGHWIIPSLITAARRIFDLLPSHLSAARRDAENDAMNIFFSLLPLLLSNQRMIMRRGCVALAPSQIPDEISKNSKFITALKADLNLSRAFLSTATRKIKRDFYSSTSHWRATTAATTTTTTIDGVTYLCSGRLRCEICCWRVVECNVSSSNYTV